jgi:hypothetical protein
MTIEIFKTNVDDPQRAKYIVEQIERHFVNCKANFDLADSDRILRVASEGDVQCDLLIDFLSNVGCAAEVLSDTIQTT